MLLLYLNDLGMFGQGVDDAVIDQASNWQANYWITQRKRTPQEEDLERARLGIIAFPEVVVSNVPLKANDYIHEPENVKVYDEAYQQGLDEAAKQRRRKAIILLLH